MSIPRIIHQIWIGKDDIPDLWKKDCDEIETHHPDWEYRLWKNSNVMTLMETAPKNIKNAYDRYWQREEWAYACDIVRYLILHEFGGVYMDCDFRMKKNGSLNQLPLEKNLILLNMRLSTLETPKIRLQNCFIASAPKTKFMRRVLDRIDNIDYKLTTLDGRLCDKYSTQYLTIEYGMHIGMKHQGEKSIHKIKENISHIIPNDEIIIPRHYFIGKGAIIASHRYRRSHKKRLDK